MLSRWFARFKLDPDTLRQQKWFALFGERLLAPALWQGGSRALSGAVAAGIFACWFPIPMHSLIAVGLALAFSLNLPLALLAVLTALSSGALTALLLQLRKLWQGARRH